MIPKLSRIERTAFFVISLIILSDLSTDNNTISLGFQRQRPQIARILVFSNTLTFVLKYNFYAKSNNDIFYKYKVGQTANA
jgi:hypothetical protein